MENDSDFRIHSLEEQNRSEQRYYSMKMVKKIAKNFPITIDQYTDDPQYLAAILSALISFDVGLSTKFAVHACLYLKTLHLLGTSRHRQLMEAALKFEDIGCFALTELGHGSNVRDIMTTAHYDSDRQEFIINTPNDLAMKFWIGAAAQLANVSVVWAQLYIGDQCQGVFAFYVPIRDKKTHLPLPGVVIGDCGPKNGLNFRIPSENLLNKLATVDEKGNFIPTIKNPDKRFALSLGALSGGRQQLALGQLQTLRNALVIGTRFSATRRQFGSPNEQELAILEYPLVQSRLISYIASLFTHWFATQAMNAMWYQNQNILFESKNPLLSEVHALSSIVKPLNSWLAQRGIQEMRELLGGLGYSSFSRLGAYLNDNDVQQTWEGDNNVLLQQASKYVIEVYIKMMQNAPLNSNSLSFLTLDSYQDIEPVPLENCTQYKVLNQILEYRVIMLIQTSFESLQDNLSTSSNQFEAWNKTVPYDLKPLAVAYGEAYISKEFLRAIKSCTEKSLKNIFKKLYELWAINSILKDLGNFLLNGHIGSDHVKSYKQKVAELCSQLKDEVVTIMDVIAPPDFILGSPFGASDGDIYNRFLSYVWNSPKCFGRPEWWKEFKDL